MLTQLSGMDGTAMLMATGMQAHPLMQDRGTLRQIPAATMVESGS